MTDKEFYQFQSQALKSLVEKQEQTTGYLARMAQNSDLMNQALRLGGLAKTPSRILARQSFTFIDSNNRIFRYRGEAACRFTFSMRLASLLPPYDVAMSARIGKDLNSPFYFGATSENATPAAYADKFGPLAFFGLNEFLKSTAIVYEAWTGETTNTIGLIDPGTGDVNTATTPTSNSLPSGNPIYSFQGDFYFTELTMDFNQFSGSPLIGGLTIWGE